MKCDWREVKLQDIALELSDGLHKAPTFCPKGEYIFVNATNIENGRIVEKDPSKKTSLEEFLKYGVKLTDRTILYSIDGTIGNIAKYRGEKCLLGKGACYITLDDSVDVDYMYYLLQSPGFNEYIHTMSTGSTIKHISLKTMRNFKFQLPSIVRQKKIGSVLASIDNEIELNNRINENLQQQARAIFYNHFINIDAVPNGWKTGNLLDIATYLNGLAMQKFRPQGNEIGLPVLKIKELRQGSCDSGSELCSPSIKSEYIIHDGDVIFSWSGSLLVDIWCGGTCGLNQHLFKVTSDTYDKWFYYLWTVHHLNKFIAIAADKATTMGHIKREDLAKAEVLIPSAEDYKKISAVMNPIFELITTNRIEVRKLAELRDELLPKLMAGEIDVSDIDI